MDKLYGKIFKKIRIERGYSIKEIADSVVSNSTISQFENGKSTISIEKFFHALTNMNISPEDYFMRLEKTNHDGISSDRATIKKSFDSGNSYVYKNILERIEQHLEDFPEKKYLRLQIISLKANIRKLEADFPIKQKEIEEAKLYLKGTSTWGIFDIRLFSSLYPFLDKESAESLTHRLLDPLNYPVMGIQHYELLYITLNNIITWATEKNDFELVEKLIDYVACHPAQDYFIGPKLWIKFAIGQYHYKIGEKIKGKKEMQEVIEALEIAECYNWAKRLKNEFLKI